MFLRRSRSSSIASQLVFLFTLAAAFLLCCGLVILYIIVVRHAFEEDNEVLADKIFALRADLESSGGPAILLEELKIRRKGERIAYWVRALDSDGRTVAEKPGMKEILPPNIFPPAQDFGASIPAPKDFRTQGKLFSLVTTSEQANGQNYLLQVAQDRSEDERFTLKFGALLGGVLALGILASALIAINVTKRGLRPLAEMTRSLERVGPKRLHERVPPAGWPRELQPLVVAFDEMLDRLEDSFTRLSQFSADLAHELRTPIANLRGEAEVALTRQRTSDEYREVIESNVGECERLSAMIDNLLFLARAEAADGAVEREELDGRSEIEKIIAYYETIAEERQIKIECSGEGEIHAQRILFSRALSNLVENGLRYTPDGGRIAIELRVDGEGAEISVRDNGCGIAPPHLARVFDRFYRVDSSRSSEGTGLGLAMVKSITDLHGGTARIESEIGKGTRVTLYFPSGRLVKRPIHPNE